MDGIDRGGILSAAMIIGMALASPFADAHEFWIEPERGMVGPGDRIVADLKVGQMLKGDSYPYLSNRFQSFDIRVRGETIAVAGSEGDIPALNQIARRPWLCPATKKTALVQKSFLALWLSRRGPTGSPSPT